MSTWFTNGKARKGLFYARSRDGGQNLFRSACRLANRAQSDRGPTCSPARMALAMVWKEFDGEKTTVNLMTSRDDGESWSTPKAIASTNQILRIIRCWSRTAVVPIFPG